MTIGTSIGASKARRQSRQVFSFLKGGALVPGFRSTPDDQCADAGWNDKPHYQVLVRSRQIDPQLQARVGRWYLRAADIEVKDQRHRALVFPIAMEAEKIAALIVCEAASLMREHEAGLED